MKNKSLFLSLIILFVFGCGSTKVFMGSYDLVKITVSDSQATMSAENLPHETLCHDGMPERKVIEGCSVVDGTPGSNAPASGSRHPILHVNIVCPDEELRNEFFDNFYKEGFTLEKRFHKHHESSRIISEITIHPKRRCPDCPDGEYHTITFRTMGGLCAGSHRVLVEDPLAFAFQPANVTPETNEITMVITNAKNIKGGKFVVKGDTAGSPMDRMLQVLSQIISNAKRPVKILFTVRERM